jgi:hypothetical protein
VQPPERPGVPPPPIVWNRRPNSPPLGGAIQRQGFATVGNPTPPVRAAVPPPTVHWSKSGVAPVAQQKPLPPGVPSRRPNGPATPPKAVVLLPIRWPHDAPAFHRLPAPPRPGAAVVVQRVVTKNGDNWSTDRAPGRLFATEKAARDYQNEFDARQT